MPARNRSLCETTSASAGSSRSVGIKYCDQRIGEHFRLAKDLTQTTGVQTVTPVRFCGSFLPGEKGLRKITQNRKTKPVLRVNSWVVLLETGNLKLRQNFK